MVKPKANHLKFQTGKLDKKELKIQMDALAPIVKDREIFDRAIENALNPPDTSALEKQIRELEITNESLQKDVTELEIMKDQLEVVTDGNGILINENDTLKAENESLKKELEDRCIGVESKLINYVKDEKNAKIAGLEAENESLKTRVQELDMELCVIKSSYDTIKAENEEKQLTIDAQNQLIAVFRMIFETRKTIVTQEIMEKLLLEANIHHRDAYEELRGKMCKVVDYIQDFMQDPRVGRLYEDLYQGRLLLQKHKAPEKLLFTEVLDYATVVDDMRGKISILFSAPINTDPKEDKMSKEQIEECLIKSIRLNPEEFRQKLLKDTAGLKEFLRSQGKDKPNNAEHLEDAMRLADIIAKTPSKDTADNAV